MTAQPDPDMPGVPARRAGRLVELNGCLSLKTLPGRDLHPSELAEARGLDRGAATPVGGQGQLQR